jgi:hypothetical protein
MRLKFNEDVNGFTFKDLFGKDFDEILVEALQFFEDLVADGEFSWTNIFKDEIDPGVVESKIESDIVADVVYALLDKIDSFKTYNALRVDLGMDEVEVDEAKEESIRLRKRRVQEAERDLRKAKRALREALVVSSMGETNMSGSGRTTFVSSLGSVSKKTKERRRALLND